MDLIIQCNVYVVLAQVVIVYEKTTFHLTPGCASGPRFTTRISIPKQGDCCNFDPVADAPTALHPRTAHCNFKGSLNEQLLSQGLLVLMTVISTGKSGGEVICDESRYSDKIHHIYPSQSK